jgi:thymidylate synthase
MNIVGKNANQTWLRAMYEVMTQGLLSQPRGQAVREVLGMTTRFPMLYPILSVPERKISHQFMAAEAHWILSGSNRLDHIQPWAKSYGRFSDDGETLHGAYGPKIAEQLDSVLKALTKDQDSRQAVINIWRENPPESKDIPCTTSVHWMIRDNQLHCFDNMRSSDLWLGWPYDVFSFTALSHLLLHHLWIRGFEKLTLGTMTLHANSSHLYQRDWDKVREVLLAHVGNGIGIPSYRFSPLSYTGPTGLMNFLRQIRNGVFKFEDQLSPY